MLKITLIAAALALGGAGAASAQGWNDQGYSAWDSGQQGYGYGNGTSALGRSCPSGYYPESFPNGSGVRCEPVGGTTRYIQGY